MLSEKTKTIIHKSFEKEYKYIEKKVVRYIYDNLNDFSYSDESDEE